MLEPVEQPFPPENRRLARGLLRWAHGLAIFLRVFLGATARGGLFLRKTRWESAVFRYILRGALPLNRALGLRVVVLPGAPVIEPHETFIVTANHTSYLDVPALAEALAGRLDKFTFIQKRELLWFFPVNLVAWMLRGVLVRRGDPLSGRQALEQSLQNLQDGVSMIFCPEGTRNRNLENEPLQPFKIGAFHLAMSSGFPVLPVTVVGSHHLLPADEWIPLLPRFTVLVRIGEPFYPSRFADAEELKQAVWERHRQDVGELTPLLPQHQG